MVSVGRRSQCGCRYVSRLTTNFSTLASFRNDFKTKGNGKHRSSNEDVLWDFILWSGVAVALAYLLQIGKQSDAFPVNWHRYGTHHVGSSLLKVLVKIGRT
eukprot:scaffold473_cov189-Alexandrium_tamarense.AAC.28